MWTFPTKKPSPSTERAPRPTDDLIDSRAPQKRVPRVFALTDPATKLELFQLYDNFSASRTHANKFRLWHRISELYPATLEGQWHIKTPDALTFEIHEGPSPDR